MDGAGPGSAPEAGGRGTGAVGEKRKKRKLADLSTEEINEIIGLKGKMPQAAVGKRYGLDQADVSAIQRGQVRGKPLKLGDDRDKKVPVKRIRDVELTLPLCYGTYSFWLGKKADDFHSHKWTVLVRAANDEDLGGVVRRVTFTLHPSFKDPVRVVERPPFELTETGWGEFEMGITIHFHSDAADKPVELLHHLKLYADDDPSGQQLTARPVIAEAYDEIVFPEPSEPFFQRAAHMPCMRVAVGASAVLPPPPPPPPPPATAPTTTAATPTAATGDDSATPLATPTATATAAPPAAAANGEEVPPVPSRPPAEGGGGEQPEQGEGALAPGQPVLTPGPGLPGEGGAEEQGKGDGDAGLGPRRGDTKGHPLVQWFVKYSDAEELQKLAGAREQLAKMITTVEKQLGALEAQVVKLRPGG